MEATRNLCAQIPISLHDRVREERESLGQSLSEYVTQILREHFEGGKPTMTTTKTLAFQIPEELDLRIKKYLASEKERTGKKVSQREFIVGLIEQALDAYAQYQLGRMYRDGIGTGADLEESGRWYAKAYTGFLTMEATMADDKLCYRLGSMNMTGTGTEVDLEKSRYYFKKAVELGSADALYGLGKLYLKLEFSEYDPEKAVEYLELVAAKDNAFAKYQLGKLFCQGKLVQKDIARGLPLLKELAEAGVTSAAYIAGKVYLKEEGWQDVQKAICCFHIAAEDGNSYAEYQLGKIYYFGNGIRADREKGVEYLNQSAAHGNVYAKNLLRVIRQQHIRGAASLIAQLGRMFQEKEQDQRKRPGMDRKQRQEIEEKKQALGIRD